MRNLIVWMLVFVCASINLHAQRATQLWGDFQVFYPFKSQYMFDMEASYQRLLQKDSTWRSLGLTPNLTYQFFTNVDFAFSLPLAFTNQTKDYESFEARPTLEVGLYLTQNRRINTRLIFRLDKRFFLNLDTDDWDNSTRFRTKAEAIIAINGPNIYQDNLWTAIVDYEEFVVIDRELDERYSNKRRARLGAGYRLNYKNRFDLIFTIQSARNKIGEDFNSTDNVVQLRYKMFLNPATPTQTD